MPLWAFLALTGLSFGAIAMALWPEMFFKRPALSLWQRAALTAALAWTHEAVGAAEMMIGSLPCMAVLGPKTQANWTHFAAGFMIVRAIVYLLPWLFVHRLRNAISFRMRGTRMALIFLPPLAIGLLSFAEILDPNWSGRNFFMLYCMLTGLVEETLYRGYAFQLNPEKRPREAIIVTSVIFALAHLPSSLHQNRSTPLHLLFVFFFAVGLGVVRLSTGSIGLCILIHGLFDMLVHVNDPAVFQIVAPVVAVSTMAALHFHPACRKTGEIEPEVGGLLPAGA